MSGTPYICCSLFICIVLAEHGLLSSDFLFYTFCTVVKGWCRMKIISVTKSFDRKRLSLSILNRVTTSFGCGPSISNEYWF